MIKNWPAYVVFDDETICIFNINATKPLFATTIKNKYIDNGRINVGKWICYNKEGISKESTKILRKFLSV